jgi:hypothetical protein
LGTQKDGTAKEEVDDFLKYFNAFVRPHLIKASDVMSVTASYNCKCCKLIWASSLLLYGRARGAKAKIVSGNAHPTNRGLTEVSPFDGISQQFRFVKMIDLLFLCCSLR